MDPYGYKVFVPTSEWVLPHPALTKFSPGHDARIMSDPSRANNPVTVTFEFNTIMSCTSVTNALTLNMSSSGHGSNPTFDPSSVMCGPVQNPDPL
ncbi:hypothetical protein EI94DRAFT_1622890 [Lactarius quietus]|nr:hypothetical protein EI94DRAFT_1622890 [Lactarius quietus]